MHNLETYARRWLDLGKNDLEISKGLYFAPYDSLVDEFRARGKKLVSFSHYDYLGLSGHPAVSSAVGHAVAAAGTSAGASRMVGGERASHRDFEQALAKFLKIEDAVSLVSGYGTNVSLLGHVLGGADVIISDELSHNSILSGTKLSRAQSLSFAHNDLDALEHVLRTRRPEFGRALIVIEGLYSMDGDIPDLERVLALRDRYDAWLMIDEAHSIGVLGDTGRGLSEHFNVDANRIDFIIGTLSKAFVSCGGFIGGKHAVIEWLRYTLPGFIYSVGLAPPVTAAAHAALKVFSAEPERVRKMRDNSGYFLEQAGSAGLDTGEAVGVGVVPIIFKDVAQTVMASRALLAAGYFVPPIIHVGVPKDKPRLRFFLSAAHTFEEIDGVIAQLASLAGSRVQKSRLEPAISP